MFKNIVTRVFSRVGIAVNGGKPWDLQVRDDRFYDAILTGGSLALGESYMNGWWEAEDVETFIRKLLSHDFEWIPLLNPVTLWQTCKRRFFDDAATLQGSRKVADLHYNLGNDLYRNMLGASMAYSCAYWRTDVTDGDLDAAQQAKFRLIGDKLHLAAGERLLDIGCGWGSFLRYAATAHNVQGTGVTIASEQARFAREFCANLPVKILLEDYRQLDDRQKFDKIVSVGMFEHVEPRRYREFFAAARRVLKPGGLLLLHTIGNERSGAPDAWTRKYIFPVGVIPSRRKIEEALGGTFRCLDWHSLGGEHYAKTLRAWRNRFLQAWPTLQSHYSPLCGGMFKRMWNYYLSSCAGAFDAHRLDVFQIVLTPVEDAAQWQNYSPIR